MNILRILLRSIDRARARSGFPERLALTALFRELEAEIKALEKEEAKGS